MSAHAPVAGAPEAVGHADHGDRGFAKLDYQLNDYPGPVKTTLFGIQHVLVMCTAMILNLLMPKEH